MPKIRLAHIITGLELGGAQKTTLSLLACLDRALYDVFLFTSDGGYLAKKAGLIQGLKVIVIDSLVRDINLVKDARSFFKIAYYLRRYKISVVHTHSSKAGIIGRWAARLSGVKYVFHTVHGWPFYIESGAFTRFAYRMFEKITSLITTKLIVVSDKDMMAGLKYVNSRGEKYAKISYGIDRDGFAGGINPGKRDDTVRVGFIACFKPQKAPMDFIKVVKLVTDKNKAVEFISAGDGLLRPLASEQASRLGVDGYIKFLGWQEDIADILSRVDMLLLTSRWEGLPVVILEAFAAGKPVIATKAGGIPEIISNGVNGFLEEKGDCLGLARDILILASDSKKLRAFSKNAADSFKPQNHLSYMVNRIQSLYGRAGGV
ncbi:MAG: glycosyltransferase family 4 protein [Candidatus Omnitrophica bacterium]|jgi:glycosyltransferase involved in cell wall biosynthesis|nr:glycosyltransferase family 4 protein [Candidatus Omnitrophota bacterium]